MTFDPPVHVASPDIQTRREETREDLTEEDLEQAVSIHLTETPTIWLLDLPGISISNEAQEAATIKEKNLKYQEVGSHKIIRISVSRQLPTRTIPHRTSIGLDEWFS